MLKLKLQYFGHLMRRADSLENPKQKKIAFLRFTCQDGARHSYWIVKISFVSV